MADKAHIETDKKLEEMERHLSAIYSRAQKETGKSWKKYLQESDEEIINLQYEYEKARELYDGKEIKRAWRELVEAKKERTLQNKRFRDLSKKAAEDLLHVNEIALAYVNGQLPEVYAINYNAFENTANDNLVGYSFTLTDADTVKNLATEDKTLLPYKEMDSKKDVKWNTKKINAEVLQGILQGESMDKIADRFSTVVGMNEKSAIRNARTTVTSAENKGRQDSYVRATADGIQLEREWVATEDARTRHSHLMLDGQTAPVDKPFQSELGKIMYPGDPHAAPGNVYNCRCTLVAKVLGFAKKTAQAASGAVQEAKNKFSLGSFKEHAETYIGGGYDIDSAFTKEDIKYIKDNMVKTKKPLYRVESFRHTAEKLDSDMLDADNFKFSGSLRSFTRNSDIFNGMLDENSDDFAGIENPVIFETVGTTEHFNLHKYAGAYQTDQEESLVSGHFEVVGEDMKKIGGQFVRIIKIKQVRK